MVFCFSVNYLPCALYFEIFTRYKKRKRKLELVYFYFTNDWLETEETFPIKQKFGRYLFNLNNMSTWHAERQGQFS